MSRFLSLIHSMLVLDSNSLRNYDLIAGTASIIGQHSRLVKITERVAQLVIRIQGRSEQCKSGQEAHGFVWEGAAPHLYLATTIPVS